MPPPKSTQLECVVNVSEGRDDAILTALGDAAGAAVLDVHRDSHHHRAVFTLGGRDVEAAARALAASAVAQLDLRTHTGVHPRFGVVDVVPFVPLFGASLDVAVAARDAFARWAADELQVPCFLYGPERSLPDVRRTAFSTRAPDVGPSLPHTTAGACAVGARPVLVAYNLWLRGSDLAAAKRIARSLRSPQVRALAFAVGADVQVSCNLIAPELVGPAAVYDRVAAMAPIGRAELVGLAPRSIVQAVDRARWLELDLSDERTIEARLKQ